MDRREKTGFNKWFEYHCDLFNYEVYGGKINLIDEDYKEIEQTVLGNEELNDMLFKLIKDELKKKKELQEEKEKEVND